jgi:hypothetical protein
MLTKVQMKSVLSYSKKPLKYKIIRKLVFDIAVSG